MEGWVIVLEARAWSDLGILERLTLGFGGFRVFSFFSFFSFSTPGYVWWGFFFLFLDKGCVYEIAKSLSGNGVR